MLTVLGARQAHTISGIAQSFGSVLTVGSTDMPKKSATAHTSIARVSAWSNVSTPIIIVLADLIHTCHYHLEMKLVAVSRLINAVLIAVLHVGESLIPKEGMMSRFHFPTRFLLPSSTSFLTVLRPYVLPDST